MKRALLRILKVRVLYHCCMRIACVCPRFLFFCCDFVGCVEYECAK
jgi:hypothetical protein